MLIYPPGKGGEGGGGGGLNFIHENQPPNYITDTNIK